MKKIISRSMFKSLSFRSLTFLNSLLFLLPHSASAFELGRSLMTAALGCAQLLEPALHALVEDQSGKTLTWVSDNGELTSGFVSLGKLRGRGLFGALYEIESITLDEIASELSNQKTLIKLPLSYTGESPMFHARDSQKRELENYYYITEQLQHLEMHPRFPERLKGRRLIVPITAAKDTSHGLALFKPEVTGYFLKDISTLIRNNDGNLPHEMKTGLRDIYDLVQLIYRTIRTREQQLPYSTDIRPPNLIWIHEPKMLAMMHMSQPGFALFEMDITFMNMPAYIEKHTTLEAYEANFLKYALAASKPSVMDNSLLQ